MATAVEFENVSKQYRLGSRLGDLRDFVPDPFAALRGWWRGRGRRTSAPSVPPRDGHMWAVRDVSFRVEQGEAVGIIGANGAGKSTVLKLLAGITEQTCGRITTKGRLSALIEVGAGFHPDLTGRENVYLNGSILGLSRHEIAARFDSIVEFAEIERFVDTPVKRYSSGMYMRLGFAVAAHLDPDILLVDEVLAVGDPGFQHKCLNHMRSLLSSGRTVLFVSHNLPAVAEFCSRAVVMSSGEKRFEGDTQAAIAEYFEILKSSLQVRASRLDAERLGSSVITGDAEITEVAVLNSEGIPVTQVVSGTRGEVRMRARFNAPLENPEFALVIRRTDGLRVTDVGTASLGIPSGSYRGGQEVEVSFRNQWSLGSGAYLITVHITDLSRRIICDLREAAATLVVISPNTQASVADLGTTIAVRSDQSPGAAEVAGALPQGRDGRSG